jgi:hypothetical protein
MASEHVARARVGHDQPHHFTVRALGAYYDLDLFIGRQDVYVERTPRVDVVPGIGCQVIAHWLNLLAWFADSRQLVVAYPCPIGMVMATSSQYGATRQIGMPSRQKSIDGARRQTCRPTEDDSPLPTIIKSQVTTKKHQKRTIARDVRGSKEHDAPHRTHRRQGPHMTGVTPEPNYHGRKLQRAIGVASGHAGSQVSAARPRPRTGLSQRFHTKPLSKERPS